MSVIKKGFLTKWDYEKNCEVNIKVKRLLVSNGFKEKSFNDLVSGKDYLLADFIIKKEIEYINDEIICNLEITDESDNIAVYMDLDDSSRDMLDVCECLTNEVLKSCDMDDVKEMHKYLRD